MAIAPIFFHGNPCEGMDKRFDTAMMPNGSIAVLNHIAKSHGLVSAAVDESYLGQNNDALSVLTQLIETQLQANRQPVVLASILSYNASTTLLLLETLKKLYGQKIRVGVGGQLIRVNPTAYLNMTFLDHIAVGDAETTLLGLLNGERFQSGYITNGKYQTPDYDNYWAIEERLSEMSSFKLGPFSNIRQLVMESVRGCAWANVNQVCDMCSLQGVDAKPNFQNLKEHFELEKRLQERWGATWAFDVSNQWLPTLNKTSMVEWLKNYCHQRQLAFGNEGGLNKYVYLTANSITPETAPLLRQAGIKVAYIGFDGWDKETLMALHKSQPPISSVLQICRDNDLHIRTSLVIGNGVSNKNIDEMPDFVQRIIGEYGDIIRSWGNFIQIVLPGSPVFARFNKLAKENGWTEASTLYQKFEESGFFTWAEQSRLNELFIRHTQGVDYDRLVAARDRAEQIVTNSPHTTGITIEHGGEIK